MKQVLLMVMLSTGLPSNSFCQTTNDSNILASQMQQAVVGWTDIKKVKELLDLGFDIDSPIGCGTFNALDGAVIKQDLELVQLLLARGAKPKGSALIKAALGRNDHQSYEIAKALLDAGADVNYKSWYEKQGFNMAIHYAVYSENEELVKLLLSQKGVELNRIDIDGNTPLMIAAIKGNQKIVEMLLAAGADPSIKNENGETATSQIEKEIENFQKIKARLKAE